MSFMGKTSSGLLSCACQSPRDPITIGTQTFKPARSKRNSGRRVCTEKRPHSRDFARRARVGSGARMCVVVRRVDNDCRFSWHQLETGKLKEQKGRKSKNGKSRRRSRLSLTAVLFATLALFAFF